MQQDRCPQCNSDTFTKGPSDRVQVSEGVRLVQVQCASCNWSGGYGIEAGLPRYLRPASQASHSDPAAYDQASLMVAEWREQDRRRVRLQRMVVRAVLVVMAVGIIALLGSLVIRQTRQASDQELSPLETVPTPDQISQEDNPGSIPVQEFVLRNYQPTEGFTTVLKPMRLLGFREGTTSTTYTVLIEETPWVILWDYLETSALSPLLRVSLTSRATGLTEDLVDLASPSGANHAILQAAGDFELSIDASGTQWKVWVLLEAESEQEPNG